jgi:hypothetical protein
MNTVTYTEEALCDLLQNEQAQANERATLIPPRCGGLVATHPRSKRRPVVYTYCTLLKGHAGKHGLAITTKQKGATTI